MYLLYHSSVFEELVAIRGRMVSFGKGHKVLDGHSVADETDLRHIAAGVDCRKLVIVHGELAGTSLNCLSQVVPTYGVLPVWR